MSVESTPSDESLAATTTESLGSTSLERGGQSSLMFNFERVVPNPYGPVNIIAIHQAVLIPTGKESELTLLQQQLTARCPKAQIALA